MSPALLRLLQDGHNCLDTAYTKAALGIADEKLVRYVSTRILTSNVDVAHWILLDTKLAPEVALTREVERMRKTVVRLLESSDPKSAYILNTLQTGRSAGTERRRAYTRVTELSDDVRDDIFDRAERCTWELEGPFDLEAVHGGKLRQNDQRTHLHEK